MINIYDQLIYKLSKKYKLSDLEVERIVDSQFKVLSDKIAERSTETLILTYIGKFTPPLSRLRKLERLGISKESDYENKESNTNN